MSEFKVDKNIALWVKPPGGPKQKYPFPNMDVGDSFFVPGGATCGVRKNRVYAAATAYGRTHNMRFSGRMAKENGVEGVRIWRVE